MTVLATVELTVYPYECDAYGHLNHAAFLAMLERARWESLARGPGMDLFKRNGVFPAVRKATVDYHAAAYPGDRLRIETTVIERGTTSLTLRQAVARPSDNTVVGEAELVFVLVDAAGRPTPFSDELARFFGPRTGGGPAAAARDTIRVSAGGADLAVEVRGEGPPLLFVHGFPFDRTMWRHQLAALAKWKRIAPDLRGAGASSVPSDGYSVARYAEDLAAVLDAVGVGPVVACGLSMGGYVLFELWRRHPGRIRAIVLCDTKPEADSPQAKRGRDEVANLAQREGVDAVVERLLPKTLGRATRSAQPEVVRFVRDMMCRMSVPGLVGALLALRDRPDSTPTLATIAVPTLVVSGEEDEISPPAVMRAMAAAIPGAKFALIPAAGHLAPLEQPLATTRAVADFLDALP